MVVFSLSFEEDPVFCLSFHPEKPEFALGFASGRITCYSYKTDGSPSHIEWSTKRHKRSCRAVTYTTNGKHIISVGSDKVIKKADSKSGKVEAKSLLDHAATCLAITESHVLVGDEEGCLLGFELTKLQKKYDLGQILEQSVNSIANLYFRNRWQFIVSGGTHVACIDLRKPEKKEISEDQEDEVLCGCVASESHSAFGLSEGVLSVWKNKHLIDQQQRVKLSREGSVESVIAGEADDHVVAGTSDGQAIEVNLLTAKPGVRWTHHQSEEVSMLDWDHEYRLVTGSMGMVKLWDKGESDKAEQHSKKKRKLEQKTQEKPIFDL